MSANKGMWRKAGEQQGQPTSFSEMRREIRALTEKEFTRWTNGQGVYQGRLNQRMGLEGINAKAVTS